MCRSKAAEYEASSLDIKEPDATGSSESAPIEAEIDIEAAGWLDLNDEDLVEPAKDIFQITKNCMKMVKQLKSGRTVKMMTQLTAVTEYVKLRARYRAHPKCKRPCLNASLAIAARMGKGPYFARQIRYNEAFLLKHQCLPPSSENQRNLRDTLLNNEDVVLAVRRYLAAQNLGTITPFELCRHVNEIIIPTLGAATKKSSICERTAISWLHKLGYQCKDVKKGVYFDGHERPDVVEARTKFLQQMKEYERSVFKQIISQYLADRYGNLIVDSCANTMTRHSSRSHQHLVLARRNMFSSLKMSAS